MSQPVSNKACGIRDALIEVRLALPRISPAERAAIVDGRRSIQECEWAAHSRTTWK